ncbi:AAA family ATPase [Vibrio sp. 99K-1]|uniref:AAA family ATPase n=1 Tax=Vibrio sp. 99K-1 TaxID=2607603 RepID=UPI001C0F42D2|nr:AAA family ATPase [Vibrio sp. 99K-1]
MNRIYIEKLHVKNFRQFDELNVSFNQGFNFIAGPNGCGKTSILSAIAHSISTGSFGYSRFKTGAEVWTDMNVQGAHVRIGFGSGAIRDSGYRNATYVSHVDPPVEQGRKVVPIHQSEQALTGALPLFIGASRSIKYKKIQGMTREPTLNENNRTYVNSGNSALYGDKETNIKQWIINRDFLIEKDWAEEERANWNHMLGLLPEIGPFDSNFSYIKTGRDLEPEFSLYGQSCYLEELSSGFQAVLSIIANIIEWIEGTRPEGMRSVIAASGTVLIDELDLHLHPEWQFTLRNGLEKLFPNIQFIVTTHSPHILASAKQSEVIVMPKIQGGETYNLQPTNTMFSGWNTDQILADVMGVQSLENKQYAQLIATAFEHVEKHNPEALQLSIDDLLRVTHPNDVIVPVLQAKLASMVAMQND